MIDQKTFLEYERVRASGHCNMLDRNCVRRQASLAGLRRLGGLDDREYIDLLLNYEDLRDRYGGSDEEPTEEE